MRYILFTIHLLLFTLLFAGCVKKQLPDGLPKLLPCQIILMQEGKPLTDAAVSLVPQDGEWSANGVSNSGGVAEMYTSGRYKGAAAGKYKVAIIKTEIIPGKPLPNSDIFSPDQSFALVEPQYSSQTATPLMIEVSEGTKEYKLDAGKTVRTAVKDRW